MNEIRLQANGLRFGALEHGEGDRTALVLHGFPDDPHSMAPMMEELAEAGWRCVAPWMRGYGPTDLPDDGDYTVSALASDVIGLLDALDWERSVVVGHDWGAIATYAACNLAPHRIPRIACLSVPPIRVFLRNALRHPEQFLKSWYIFFFQMPLLPEWWLGHDDFETLEGLWRQVLEAAGRSDGEFDDVKQTFRRPGTLRAALGYYRNVFPRTGQPPGSVRESWRLATGRIGRPTLMVTGGRDPAIGIESFDDVGDGFADDWRLEVFEEAGHFVQLHEPAAIAGLIDEFAAG